ncbi:nuclear transport factor 2 family protein [candidate division KSB1 bacterium]|nr:nuclear transport factor 2 family protein [candidate division KSB1 bacterium]
MRPTAITLVLEKKSADWKIVHTHSSPLDFPPPDNN